MNRWHLACLWRTYIWWFRHLGKGLRLLLRLSKKSKWPIRIILAPLKINNLQAIEDRKMSRFKVFRQPRYFLLVSEDSRSFDIQTIYEIIWANGSVSGMARKR